MTTETWERIWKEFEEWYVDNDQSSWKVQQEVIMDIVDKYIRIVSSKW